MYILKLEVFATSMSSYDNDNDDDDDDNDNGDDNGVACKYKVVCKRSIIFIKNCILDNHQTDRML